MPLCLKKKRGDTGLPYAILRKRFPGVFNEIKKQLEGIFAEEKKTARNLGDARISEFLVSWVYQKRRKTNTFKTYLIRIPG